MRAVAYIRRSASGEAQASEELQRDTVARLAGERGDTVTHVFRDWGRSGGSEDRPQYRAMLTAAEAGDVSAIYAYDQDRLARSNWMFAGLLRLADLQGFSIITTAGDITDPDRRDFAEMRGVMDGGELRKITRRNRAIIARMKDRGDDFGKAPFGYAKRRTDDGRVEIVKADPDAISLVVETYREVGTFVGTAHRLNAEGLPTRHGRSWHPSAVRNVVRREAPELVEGVKRGSRGPGRPRLLAGILRCHCGGPMTPGSGRERYYCSRSTHIGSHPTPRGIAESKLLPWIREEADRLAIPGDELEVGSEGPEHDDSEARQRLEAARDLVGEDAYREALDRLDALSERQAIIEAIPPRIDWDRESVEDINASLRAMWRHVRLGDDLMPVEADWIVPEWRR